MNTSSSEVRVEGEILAEDPDVVLQKGAVNIFVDRYPTKRVDWKGAGNEVTIFVVVDDEVDKLTLSVFSDSYSDTTVTAYRSVQGRETFYFNDLRLRPCLNGPVEIFEKEGIDELT